MRSNIQKRKLANSRNRDLWVISEDRFSDIDLSGIEEVKSVGPVKAYRISDVTRYLLSPKPIEVKKTLIGCEIRYQSKVARKTKQKFRQLFSRNFNPQKIADDPASDVVISQFRLKIPPIKDRELESHVNQIYQLLKAYDSMPKRLAQLDLRKVTDVIGICEDVSGNFSYLNLRGNIVQKITYMNNFIMEDVGVILEKAHLADGLFELRGYDFECYEQGRSYQLISYLKNGKQRACVLNAGNKVEYWIDHPALIKYMLLLEQSLRASADLKQSFIHCTRGRGNPVKLFFNKQLQIDYTKADFPQIYQDVFKTCHVDSSQRNLVKPCLNYLQIGVAFNYIPMVASGKRRLFTHIAVLHDFRALEPLKKNLPQVYAEMSKRAFFSEAGRYYLLDSVKGFSYGR